MKPREFDLPALLKKYRDWPEMVELIEYVREVLPETTDVVKLKFERDQYKRLSEEWMADHDKLKSKYEPEYAVVSETTDVVEFDEKAAKAKSKEYIDKNYRAPFMVGARYGFERGLEAAKGNKK